MSVVTIRSVLEHLIERAPSCENYARLAIRYPNAKNVTNAVLVALRDPEGGWTEEERLTLTEILMRASSDQPRKRMINLRVSQDEWNQLQKRSHALGITLSEYIRRRALAPEGE